MWIWGGKTQNIPFTLIFSNFSGQYQWVLTEALSLHLDLSRRERNVQTAHLFQWRQQSNHGCTVCSCTHRTSVGISNYMCCRDTLDIHKRTPNLVGNNPLLPWVWQQHAFSKIKINLRVKNFVGFFFLLFKAFLFLPSNTNFWQRVNSPSSFKNLKFQRANTFYKWRNIAWAPQVVVWNRK